MSRMRPLTSELRTVCRAVPLRTAKGRNLTINPMRYLVKVRETNIGGIEVFADSVEDAERIAREVVNREDCIWHYGELEVIGVS